MLLLSWNVNSVRARLDRLVALLRRSRPEVICLQELKVPDAEFPAAVLEAEGYHSAVHGQPTYNGVAILSRAPIADVQPGLGDGVEDEQSRFIAGRVGGLRVVSAYVPNGQLVGSDKWSYKLAWMRRLRGWLERTASPVDPLVLCGDFNVAPDDRDVARPEEWSGSVLCHEEARAALREVVGWGFTDAIRLHHEGPGPFTWWDYRMLAFPKGNGLRIDHIFVTAPLAPRVSRAWVDRDERKGKLPSDHAPVAVEIAD